ncbi:hypothetical protein TNCV_3355341 [Trichonephila clavipes]|nr:hypothetical protein TNCV_3355341 [Trichonephila clavipes]
MRASGETARPMRWWLAVWFRSREGCRHLVRKESFKFHTGNGALIGWSLSWLWRSGSYTSSAWKVSWNLKVMFCSSVMYVAKFVWFGGRALLPVEVDDAINS